MEIHKLHEMLTDAGIEHEFRDRTPEGWEEVLGVASHPECLPIDWGYQVIVYYPNGKQMISAIEGYGTYGYGAWINPDNPTDLIEIMGLLTPEEKAYSRVRGYLTAEEVFRRIKEAVDGTG